jgi:hypothetical protein
MMDNSVRRFTAIHIGIVLLMLLMGAMKPQLCYSEVPKTVNYQGYLTDSGGIPVDGDVDMEFSIYNVSSGGSSLWSESQTVTVQNGIYSVILGETNPINLTFDVPYYLAVKVGSDAEMTPRQPLTSVGYSFRAADADLLDGQDGSYYRNASNLDAGTIPSARLSLTDADVPDDITVDETNIASSIARVSEIMFEVLANDGSGSTLDTDFLDGQDGSYYLDWGNLSNVPVGFADGVDDNSGGDITAVNAGNGLTGGGDTDGVTLHVGAGTGISIFADTIALNTTYTDTIYVNENQGNSISSSMVQIPLSLSGSSSGAIISGDNTNTASGYGVWGEGDYGVYGKAVDSSGAGVYGQNFVDLGYNYGYLGGNTYAVYGTYGTSGPYGYIGGSNYGVYAEHRANGHWARLGTPWEGVYASATGNAYGVRGVSESGQGVRGDGNSSSGYGVYGTGWYAVYGDGGGGYGGRFHAETASGDGVWAVGARYGVYGSGNTFGLYGNGGLMVQKSGATVGTFNRTSNDGTIISFQQDGTQEGSISVSLGTVSYNAFVGAHWTQLKDGQEEMAVGTIVVSAGETIPVTSGSEKFIYVEKSIKRKQKTVYGVWHGKSANSAEGYPFNNGKPVYQIASLGLYFIRVTDTNGNVSNGDYIQSSPRPGEGERQQDDILHSYTVGKALVDVNWDDVEVDPELGYKWKLIPATLHAG